MPVYIVAFAFEIDAQLEIGHETFSIFFVIKGWNLENNGV